MKKLFLLIVVLALLLLVYQAIGSTWTIVSNQETLIVETDESKIPFDLIEKIFIFNHSEEDVYVIENIYPDPPPPPPPPPDTSK